MNEKQAPLRIYLAGRRDKHHEVSQVASSLGAMGHEVMSKWHTYAHDKLDPEASASVEDQKAALAVEAANAMALSHVVIFFTDDTVERLYHTGEHRVEMGLALAWSKVTVLIGARESLFDYLPYVFPTAVWSEAELVVNRLAKARLEQIEEADEAGRKA